MLHRSKTFCQRMTTGAVAAMLALSLGIPPAHAAESFEDRIRNAWDHLETNVMLDDLQMTFDDLVDAYYGLLYSDARYFYVDSSFSYGSNPSGLITRVIINYSYSAEEVPAMQSKFDTAMNEILSHCSDEWTDAETVLYLHDALAERCEYDSTLQYADSYAALVGGSAVCQGYSLAFCALCKEAGIPCITISSDSQNHMWNLVQVDQEWYHVDVTYDDTTPDVLGRVNHNYLLRSDDYMLADENHVEDDWERIPDPGNAVCTSNAFDRAVWLNCFDTADVLPNGTLLLNQQLTESSAITSIDQIGCRMLQITTDANGTFSADPLQTIQTYWPTPQNRVYTQCYSYSSVCNDRIYYTLPTQICSSKLDGTDVQVLHELTDAEKAVGYIYGMRIDAKGLLTYQVQSQPGIEDGILYQTIQLDVPIVTTTSSTTTTTTSSTTTTSTTLETTTSTTTITSTTPETTTSTTTTSTTPETTTSTTTTSTTPETTTSSTTSSTTSKTTTSTATTSTTPETTTTTEAVVLPPPTLAGDLDEDGFVSIADAILLCRYENEDVTVQLTAQGIANAEVTGDNLLSAADVTWILQRIAKLI